MLSTLTVLLLAAASPETAATTTVPPVQPVAAKPKKPAKICRSIVMTGSRVGSRVCKTAAEWNGDASGIEIGIKSQNGRDDMETIDPFGISRPGGRP